MAATLSGSATGSGVRGSPTASRRRLPRGRILSSPGVVLAARSPVLIQVSSDVLLAGFVGQARAKRLTIVPSNDENKVPLSLASPEEYYRLYSPLIQNLLELLGDVKERRVVVAFTDGIYESRALQAALARILLQDVGFPACCFQPLLKLIPMAFPPPQELLVVLVTRTEAHCLAHAAGHALDYTYQVCKCATAQESDGKPEETALDVCRQQEAWTRDDNMDSPDCSLVRALLQCLEACPRESRRAVARNLVFVGSIVDSKNFGIQVARALRASLLREPPKKQESSSRTESVLEKEPSAAESVPTDGPVSWTNCPIRMQDLKPLANNISVVRIEHLRPDVVPWMGASLWASHWHGIDSDAEHFQWIKSADYS